MISHPGTMQLYLKMGTGSGRLRPASYAFMNALDRVEVQDNVREQEDGFQIQFTLGKRMAQDRDLSKSDLLSVGARVVIAVKLKGRDNVLLSGVITYRNLVPVKPSEPAVFTIMGKSITNLLDREEINDAYDRLSDSAIVEKLVRKYAGEGFSVQATRTNDQPLETQRVPHQAGTDLEYIQALAKKNGFVFYSEPAISGDCRIYWGPEKHSQVNFPALNFNMGSYTNVLNLSFSEDANRGSQIKGSFLDLQTLRDTTIVPDTDSEAALSKNPLPLKNTRLLRDVAKYTASLSARQAYAEGLAKLDSVTGTGVVDTRLYGDILVAGKVIEVRGAGVEHDGRYLIASVTHKLERGQYTQQFKIAREGLGALTQKVERI